MPASLQFYANIGDPDSTETVIDHQNGEGLGFYGLGFGLSVPVGSVQNTTFVTNAAGTIAGVQCNNTSMISVGDANTAGVVEANGVSISLPNLPNYLCPLNIRFTNDDPVRVQNCKLRIFDRDNPENAASGVTTYVYESRHPAAETSYSNLHFRARNRDTWVEFGQGISSIDDQTFNGALEMTFTPSPGMHGENSDSLETDSGLGYQTTEGVEHLSTQHDWYVAISAEPTSIGSKTQYGLFFTLEYLA